MRAEVPLSAACIAPFLRGVPLLCVGTQTTLFLSVPR